MEKTKSPIDRDFIYEFDHSSKAFYLLTEYINYVKQFKQTHSKEYELIQQKFQENNHLADVILEGFDLVKFTTSDGELLLYFDKDGNEMTFTISELYERNDNSFTIDRFKKYIEQDKQTLEEIKQKESSIRTKISELKPGKPTKILGFITNFAEKERLKTEYKKKKKKLESDLKDILDEREMAEYQIESKSFTIDKFESVDKFIASLTPEQKSLIKSKYNELNEVFEIDRLYQMKLEALNSKIMTLSKFVEKNTNEDPKKVMFNLIKFLYYSYRKLPDNEKGLYFGNLSSYYDFGKHKQELEVLGKAMENQEFGKINRYVLSALEEEIEKDNLKKKQKEELLEQEVDLAEME